MHTFRVTRDLDHSATAVWELLANFADTYVYHPVVAFSESVNGQRTGLGAQRRCDLYSGGSVQERIVAYRDSPYQDLEDLKERTGITVPNIRRLAEADGFRSLMLDRRQALWEARALKDAPDLPLFTASETRDEGVGQTVALPPMPVCEQVVADYQTLRLSLKAHPLSFVRKSLRKQRFISTEELKTSKPFQRVQMAGIVLIRQRPGSAKGVCFITLEDEFGTANLVVWPKVMEAYRPVIMAARLLSIKGYVQRDVDIIHVVVTHLEDRSDVLLKLSPELMETSLARADEVNKPVPPASRTHPRNVRVIPKSRDFH